MAGRPQRKLLENKPMPESPKIVAAAWGAMGRAPPGELVKVFVPWEDFVFSTREGKPYMPPTIAKGIEHARSKGYTIAGQLQDGRGINLYVRFDPLPYADGRPGHYIPGRFSIVLFEAKNERVFRHELLHLVQDVGTLLIKLATSQKHITVEQIGEKYAVLRDGKPTGRERAMSTATPRVGKKKSVGQRLQKVAAALALPTGASRHDERRRMLYGGTKHKLQAVLKDKNGDAQYHFPDVPEGQSNLHHSEREVEMHTNALYAGVGAARNTKYAFTRLLREDPHFAPDERSQRTALAHQLHADAAVQTRSIKSPMLRNAYLKLAWQVACRELGIPETMSRDEAYDIGIVNIGARAPGMFVAGKRVKGAALEAHREVVAKRPPKVRPFTVPVPVPAPAPGVRYTSKGQPFIMADGRARFIRKTPLGARLNPLVKWDRQYEGTVGSGDYYYGPILKADAEEKFRAGLDRSDGVMKARGFSPLPLSFVVRAAMPFGSPEEAEKLAYAKRLGAETKSVVLIEDIYGRAVGRSTKPGDPTRETPHTMFNALHRLCELIASPGESVDGKLTTSIAGLRTGDISFLPCMSEAVSNNFYTAAQMMMAAAEELAVERGADPERRSSTSPYVRALFSSGLSTASGRLGAIDDPDQSLAEAFAKWCLSTDSLYLPESPILLDNKHLILREHERDRIQAIREIWSETLSTTVAAIARVFTMYVTAYYTDVIPVLQKLSDNPIFMDLTYQSAQDKIRSSGLHFQFPVSFMRPRATENAQYANELYLATRELFRGPSREEAQQAYTVVQMAWHDLRDLPELIELKRRIKAGQDREKYAFLKERYSKPRNTPQSIAKSKKILAALEVLSAAKRHRPGLWGAFIQPNE